MSKASSFLSLVGGNTWLVEGKLSNPDSKVTQWIASASELEFHKKIGPMAYASFIPKEKKCEQCHSVFMTKKQGHMDKFCSNNCKSANRRDSGVDDITKQCPYCKKDFTSNKYAKVECCSKQCARRYQHNWR